MYKNLSSIMGSSMVSKIVNINVAKGISCILVFLVLIGNALNYIDSGLDPCRGLLTDGTLVDKEEGVWQPHGCMLHKYNPHDVQTCLKNKQIAFVGDSRVRELMFVFFKIVNPTFKRPENKYIHSDIFLKEGDINVKFFWTPELNETARNLYDSWLQDPDESPSIILQSQAAHTIKRTNGSEEGLLEYTKNFTSLLKLSEQLIDRRRTKIFWILQDHVEVDKLVPERKMITNERIDQYNNVVEDVLSKHGTGNTIEILRSFKEIASGLETWDGIHLSYKTLKIEAHVLMNYLCNDKIRPIDGTCCQSAPTVTAVQILVMLIGLSCIVGAIVLIYLKHRKIETQSTDAEGGGVIENGKVESLESLLPNQKETIKKEKSKMDDITELTFALAKFALIMFYFYICDRTNLFMKSNKHFTNARFFLPLLYITLLGIFGITQTSQTALLNRDQTDEWKGWMQLIILIYHMSGASVNIPIYMHIRILVAMYLFMTGYGHFSYFWHKADYSLHRICNVLFRINLLTVSLCLVMDRSYQFYYFVPLCSFWFVILYLSMAAWPRANVKMMNGNNGSVAQENPTNGEKNYPLRNLNLRSPYAIMTLKLVLVFLGISVFFVSESYFEALFSWWPAIRLFELPVGAVREWWFRCQLDRYAMLHGAVLCFIYLIMKKLSILDDSMQGCLFSMKTSFITMTLSFGIIITYVVWLAQCTSKPACNHIHSYASIFPITAFIIIRNVPGYLRSGYSAFFAWFGKISLELFIGQYHIWLAADTKGMLVLISPEWPTLNLVITSFIFVCVAHEINLITGTFTKHVIGSPKDNLMRVLLRIFSFIASICVISFIQNTFNPSKVGAT